MVNLRGLSVEPVAGRSPSSLTPPTVTGIDISPTRFALFVARASGSEIRLVCYRDVVVEQMLVVLGADVFEHRLLHAPIAPLTPPGLIESIRIVHLEDDF